MKIDVKSRLIDAMEYDAASKRLKVFLSNGHIREYVDVPEHIFADIQIATSPGSYYSKLVKNWYELA